MILLNLIYIFNIIIIFYSFSLLFDNTAFCDSFTTKDFMILLEKNVTLEDSFSSLRDKLNSGNAAARFLGSDIVLLLDMLDQKRNFLIELNLNEELINTYLRLIEEGMAIIDKRFYQDLIDHLSPLATGLLCCIVYVLFYGAFK